jgi:hypothetical protein
VFLAPLARERSTGAGGRRQLRDARGQTEGSRRQESAQRTKTRRRQGACWSSRAAEAARGPIELPYSGAQASWRSGAERPGTPTIAWPASLVGTRAASSSRPVVALRRPGGRERLAQASWQSRGPCPWCPHAPHGFMPARVQRWSRVAPCLHRATLQWQSSIPAVASGHPRRLGDCVARVPGGRTGGEAPCNVALKCRRSQAARCVDRRLVSQIKVSLRPRILSRGWGRIVVGDFSYIY